MTTDFFSGFVSGLFGGTSAAVTGEENVSTSTEDKTADAARDALSGWHAPVGHDGVRSYTETYSPSTVEVQK